MGNSERCAPMEGESRARLADLAAEWTGADASSAGWPAAKARLSREILRWADQAAGRPEVPGGTLYRAFSLDRDQRKALRKGRLEILPRDGELLESWTFDASWALEMADGMRDGIVLARPASGLDVCCDIRAMAPGVDVECEVLVRPGPLSVTAGDLVDGD